MSDSRPYLVTGAGGFVGSNLVRHLADHGTKVRAMVHRATPDDLPPDVEVVRGDIMDEEFLRRAVQGVAGVYHIAALFRQGGRPDEEYRRVNVDGVRNVISAAAEAGVGRLVHCSTVGVLGDVKTIPADEKTPYNPGDIYQVTKMEGEQAALEAFRSGRIRGVVIRPAMVYGPGDTRTLKIFKMVAAGYFFYVGTGETLMHYVDVRDLARAFRLAMEHRERSGEVYIAAGRETVALRDLVDFSAAYLQVRRPWLHLPVRPMQWLGSGCEVVCRPIGVAPPIFRRRVDFYTKNRSFSGEKARRELGFSVDRSFQQEVVEIIDWYWSQGLLKPKTSRPGTEVSFMYRDLDGTIAGWNQESRRRYGFESAEALGSVSHRLLRTEFPEPLDRINQRLQETSVWTGHLLHTTKEGKRIEVASRWKVMPSRGDKRLRVIETNDDPGQGESFSRMLVAC